MFIRSPLLRGVARLLIVTVTAMTLQPLSAAAQVSRAQAVPQTASSPGERYGKQLGDIEETLKGAAPHVFFKGKQLADTATVKAKVKTLRDQARQLQDDESASEAEFDAIGQNLRDKNLPPEILNRHSQAVADYRSRKAEFYRLLQSVADADDHDQDLQVPVADLAGFMAKYPNRKAHTPTDPNKLPWGSPKPVTREPFTTSAQFQLSRLFGDPVKVAQAGSLSGIALPGTALSATPTAQDLAETEDVQITQSIRDLAASLNNNPVQIYNWVRNNIEFIPSYGSIQGSDMTLQTKRGNAFDTASLLIALLRASDIAARYVYGTVEVPADKVMNWVGGVTVPQAAQSLMGQGGIPNVGLVSGGQIKAIRLEHVWVEAYVDYVPSRGVRHIAGDTWVPMDGSFKQYTYTQGMDIKGAVPFDAQSFLDQIKQGATVNEAEGWVQNVNQTLIQSTLTSYQTQVVNYVNAQKPNATVGDVLGTKAIVAQNYSILMGTLPYKMVATGAKFAAIPANLQWKFAFRLYASDYDKAADSPQWDVTRSLPTLAGKRVTMAYEPSTAADAQVLASAAEAYQPSFAGYLVRVQPRLKIEDQVVEAAGSFTVGEQHILSVDVISPWDVKDRDYRMTSGDVSVIAISPAGVPAQVFSDRTSRVDLYQTNIPEYVPEMLYQIGLGWWGEKYAFEDLIAASNNIIRFNLPSHARLAAPVSVRYVFGIARSASYKGRTLDGKLDQLAVAHTENRAESARQFVLTAGQVGSYLEGSIFEQAFLAEVPYGVSTVSLLKAASEQGLRIYTITAANADQAIPLLQTNGGVIDDIRNAVAAGLKVTVSQSDVTHYGYRGIGYVLEDPITGSAAYQIDGGLSGGSSPGPTFVYPMPQPVATPIHNLMLGSSLRDANAGLVAKNGIVMGITLPAVAIPAPAPTPGNPYVLLAAAIIAALIIYSTNRQKIEERYPETSRVFRHFTTTLRAKLIWGGQIIWGRKGGTFNPDSFAVYVADVNDPQAHAACPPTADQTDRITIDYEMNNSRAEAYVDIEITRAGYWDSVLSSDPNGHGTIEWHFKLPLVYFGPGAVAITGVGECSQ